MFFSEESISLFMKKYFYTFVFILLAISTTHGQSLEWGRSFGGVGTDGVRSFALVANNDHLIAGHFSNTVDFSSGNGTHVKSSIGQSDAYILKENQNGDILWAKYFGGSGDDGVSCITSDDQGNIYIGGTFKDTVDFDPGPGVYEMVANAYLSGYLMKLDSDGNFIWAQSFGSGFRMVPQSMEVSSNTRLYIAGYFTDSVDFDYSSNDSLVFTNGNEDAFLLSLDTAGNFQWVRSFGSLYPDKGNDLQIDDQGNVYVSGSFEGVVSFGVNANETLYSQGASDLFYLKTNMNGDLIWVKGLGGNSFDNYSVIELDQQGHLISSGIFTGTVDFDFGSGTQLLTAGQYHDVFVLKMDTASNFVWAKSFGGDSYDYASSISLDNDGNVFTTGSFSGQVDFDPSSNEFKLTSVSGEDDIYLHKLDSNGNFQWVETYGGIGRDFVAAVQVDGQGKIFLLGSFENQVDFSTGFGFAQFTSLGGNDAFIIKLNQSAVSLEENSSELNLSVHPNPTEGRVELGTSLNGREVSVVLLDAQGRKIKEQSWQNFSNESIEIKGPSGLYFLKLESEGVNETLKIVKQ